MVFEIRRYREGTKKYKQAFAMLHEEEQTIPNKIELKGRVKEIENVRARSKYSKEFSIEM